MPLIVNIRFYPNSLPALTALWRGEKSYPRCTLEILADKSAISLPNTKEQMSINSLFHYLIVIYSTTV